MKASAIALLAALVSASKDSRTFAVLRFTNKQLTKGRMDPIASPGKPSAHVHTIMGGSGFSWSATGEDLVNSACSNARINGDNSAYWFPSLYFKNPTNHSFEAVEVFYVNAYYL
jgi:elongation factor P hydroxylase